MLRSTDVQLFLLRIRYDTILDTLKANFEIIERRFCAAYKCDAVKKQKFKRADGRLFSSAYNEKTDKANTKTA